MSALGMEKNGNPLLQYMRQEKLPHFFCPGCGCGQVVNAFLRAAEQLKLDLGAMVGIGGVGCTARIPVYINMDCLHGVHGRTLPWATGIKLVKPDTKVVVFAGDGDALSIGGNHFIHAARRNIDVTFIVVNNFNFAMTGGQVAPMTPDGSVTLTTPYGSSEPPFDMCALAVTAGATYVSRTLTSNPAQMTTYIKAALDHKGFSVVEILSQCPTHFGRYALGSGSPKNLVEWIKNRTIPLSAADKLPPEETAGKYRLGEFVNIERPVFRGSTLYISDDACETCDTCGEKEEAKS